MPAYRIAVSICIDGDINFFGEDEDSVTDKIENMSASQILSMVSYEPLEESVRVVDVMEL